MENNKEMRRKVWNSIRIYQLFSLICFLFYIPLILIVFYTITGLTSINVIEFLLPSLFLSLMVSTPIFILIYFRKLKPLFLGKDSKNLNWIVYKRGNYFGNYILLLLTYLYFIFYLPVFYFVKMFPFRIYELPTSLAQYQEMEDSDKLASPTYEKQESGIKISLDDD
jgi:hypothetical protein